MSEAYGQISYSKICSNGKWGASVRYEDTTVEEIYIMAIELGVSPRAVWETRIYPALAASSSTDPGEIPNSIQSR